MASRFEGGRGSGRGFQKNCAYLWKNPGSGFAPPCDTLLSSFQFGHYKVATLWEVDNAKLWKTPHFRQLAMFLSNKLLQ